MIHAREMHTPRMFGVYEAAAALVTKDMQIARRAGKFPAAAAERRAWQSRGRSYYTREGGKGDSRLGCCEHLLMERDI